MRGSKKVVVIDLTNSNSKVFNSISELAGVLGVNRKGLGDRLANTKHHLYMGMYLVGLESKLPINFEYTGDPLLEYDNLLGKSITVTINKSNSHVKAFLSRWDAAKEAGLGVGAIDVHRSSEYEYKSKTHRYRYV